MKFFCWTFTFVLIFVLGVIGESKLRQSKLTEIEVLGAPLEGVEASAHSIPDFLWIGRSWWVEIDTAVPLRLHLDEWVGRIPKGQHRIYSNHDHTNTGDHGAKDFWGYPGRILFELEE